MKRIGLKLCLLLLPVLAGCLLPGQPEEYRAVYYADGENSYISVQFDASRAQNVDVITQINGIRLTPGSSNYYREASEALNIVARDHRGREHRAYCTVVEERPGPAVCEVLIPEAQMEWFPCAFDPWIQIVIPADRNTYSNSDGAFSANFQSPRIPFAQMEPASQADRFGMCPSVAQKSREDDEDELTEADLENLRMIWPGGLAREAATCEEMECPSGFHCEEAEEAEGAEPQCVADNPPPGPEVCDVVVCGEGEMCDIDTGACVPRDEGGGGGDGGGSSGSGGGGSGGGSNNSPTNPDDGVPPANPLACAANPWLAGCDKAPTGCSLIPSTPFSYSWVWTLLALFGVGLIRRRIG